MIVPFKGRKFDPHRKIRVYRNLTGANWSIWQDGLVRAHADVVMLQLAAFKVSRARWKRSIREGRRNIHAFVEGSLATLALEVDRFTPARYNRQLGRFETTEYAPRYGGLSTAFYVILDKTGMRVR